MCSTSFVSSRLTLHIPAASSSFARVSWVSSRPCSTFRPAAASPPTAPMTAAVSMPRRPPVPGTATLFTFFTMFPLQAAFSRSGSQPRVSRASAAA